MYMYHYFTKSVISFTSIIISLQTEREDTGAVGVHDVNKFGVGGVETYGRVRVLEVGVGGVQTCSVRHQIIVDLSLQRFTLDDRKTTSYS